MKLIFLDIDGVLNGHDFCHAAQSCSIRRENVDQLNRVLRETGAKVVLSSAWRYMIHGAAMTVTGFQYMLRTHGVAGLEIVGITCTDEACKGRGKQITRWLQENGLPETYVVVDDDIFDIVEDGHPLVRTDSKLGLTTAEADRIIESLGRPTP
jgi:hypothetical protein